MITASILPSHYWLSNRGLAAVVVVWIRIGDPTSTGGVEVDSEGRRRIGREREEKD